MKPVNGFPHLVHKGLVLLFPLALFVLVRTNFVQLALILVVLSKWRMFAVRPRFWLANIRANAIDMVVGFSVLAFMTQTDSAVWQFGWVAAYVVWLLGIKPGTSNFTSSIQAGIGFAAGLTALYMAWPSAPLYGLVLATGLLCYVAARHFFDNYDEPYARLMSYLWAYFGAGLAFLLGHAMFFYAADTVAQLTVLLVGIGSGLGTLYYLDHHERLGKTVRYECLAVMAVLTLLVLGDFVFRMFGLTNNL